MRATSGRWRDRAVRDAATSPTRCGSRSVATGHPGHFTEVARLTGRDAPRSGRWRVDGVGRSHIGEVAGRRGWDAATSGRWRGRRVHDAATSPSRCGSRPVMTGHAAPRRGGGVDEGGTPPRGGGGVDRGGMQPPRRSGVDHACGACTNGRDGLAEPARGAPRAGRVRCQVTAGRNRVPGHSGTNAAPGHRRPRDPARAVRADRPRSREGRARRAPGIP